LKEEATEKFNILNAEHQALDILRKGLEDKLYGLEIEVSPVFFSSTVLFSDLLFFFLFFQLRCFFLLFFFFPFFFFF